LINSNVSKNTQIIHDLARKCGFDYCGISKAQELSNDAIQLEKWLNNGYHGKMKWMENHFEKRINPTKLVPDSKSVISLLYNYYPETNFDDQKLKISKYAYGKDYHFVIKSKLKEFMSLIQDEIGQVSGRVFVDSAPVLDRAWAAKSGLGWIGKNSMLITKQKGSFYFIAEIIIDLELIPDNPTTDHCGSCRACIDACPTDAIIDNKVIDSNKCISYLTIELKEQIPSSFKDKMEGWAFGCDICQDVCPWNRFSTPNKDEQFQSHPKLKELHKNEWTELTEEVFKDVFKKSALKRAGYMKFSNNLTYTKNLNKNSL
jgi:epoxyqueuosine reductase